jgi:hypothetical protein
MAAFYVVMASRLAVSLVRYQYSPSARQARLRTVTA